MDRREQRGAGRGEMGAGSRTSRRPDLPTLAAFAAFVVFAAGNVVGVRYITDKLPLYWGAATRLLVAAALFFAYMTVRGVPVPRGRELKGAVAFGVLQFGIGFSLAYWGLQKVPAGLGAVLLAAVPLITMFVAASWRIEKLTARGVVGAVLAVTGVAVISGNGGAGADVPFPHVAAVAGTAIAFGAAVVVLKVFQGAHPAAVNGVGTLVGGAMLLALSVLAGEPAALPRGVGPWLAWGYLAVFGSVGLFAALQYVVRRWSAAATSYQAVLSPIVAVALGAWLLGEPVSDRLLLGSVPILAGVWIGALAPRRARVCEADAAAPCV